MEQEDYLGVQKRNIRLYARLSEHLGTKLGFIVPNEYITIALFSMLVEKEHLKYSLEVYRLNISFEEAALLLSRFDFSQLKWAIYLDADLLPEEFFPSGYASIKDGGLKWEIHLNDVDPWPSRPHAHAYQKNYVLNLSNGNCYQSRRFLFSLRKKTLLTIREKFEKVYTGALPALAI